MEYNAYDVIESNVKPFNPSSKCIDVSPQLRPNQMISIRAGLSFLSDQADHNPRGNSSPAYIAIGAPPCHPYSANTAFPSNAGDSIKIANIIARTKILDCILSVRLN